MSTEKYVVDLGEIHSSIHASYACEKFPYTRNYRMDREAVIHLIKHVGTPVPADEPRPSGDTFAVSLDEFGRELSKAHWSDSSIGFLKGVVARVGNRVAEKPKPEPGPIPGLDLNGLDRALGQCGYLGTDRNTIISLVKKYIVPDANQLVAVESESVPDEPKPAPGDFDAVAASLNALFDFAPGVEVVIRRPE